MVKGMFDISQPISCAINNMVQLYTDREFNEKMFNFQIDFA